VFAGEAQWLSKSAAHAGARRQRQLSPDQTDCAHNLYQAMKCAVRKLIAAARALERPFAPVNMAPGTLT
jgi:hypothetical protein